MTLCSKKMVVFLESLKVLYKNQNILNCLLCVDSLLLSFTKFKLISENNNIFGFVLPIAAIKYINNKNKQPKTKILDSIKKNIALICCCTLFIRFTDSTIGTKVLIPEDK